jgi:hypothetical protein
VPGGLASTRLAHVTLPNSIAAVSVASAVPNTSIGKITINLNKARRVGDQRISRSVITRVRVL